MAMDELDSFLSEHGLEDYRENFVVAGFDSEDVIVDLSEEDITAHLRIEKVGHRRRVLKAVRKLQEKLNSRNAAVSERQSTSTACAQASSNRTPDVRAPGTAPSSRLVQSRLVFNAPASDDGNAANCKQWKLTTLPVRLLNSRGKEWRTAGCQIRSTRQPSFSTRSFQVCFRRPSLR